MSVENYTIGVGGMTCKGCATHLGDVLSALPGVTDVRVDLTENQTVVCVSDGGPDRKALEAVVAGAGYTPGVAGSMKDAEQPCGQQTETVFNWWDRALWRKSANNTKWCLIGCSIGDFGTIAAFQFVFTESGWSPMMIMALAMFNGIMTSIALETVILSAQMALNEAFRVAIGMSLISMLSMEAAMNIVDFVLTGGAQLTWWVLVPMLVAGFLTPWPYNYWRLKKHGQSCH